MRRPPVLLALVCLLLLAIPPVVLRAAITVTEKYVGATTTNATSYSTDSGGTNPLTAAAGSAPFSIASDALLVCGVAWSSSVTPTPALVHDSVTLDSTGGVNFDTGVFVKVYYRSGPLASSHVSMSAGSTMTGVTIACYDVAGANVGAPILQTEIGEDDATTTHSITMDGARTANSVLMHWLGHNGVGGLASVEYGAVGTASTYSSPSMFGRMQWDIGGADITPLMTSSNAVNSGQVAVEIAVASASGTKPQMLMLGVGEQ
jgi:hypothetical protein